MEMELKVVLASRSPYRRALLERVLPRFAVAPADVEESRLAGETPRDMAVRLARAKAAACAASNPTGVVIGSDQVAALGDEVLGKPGTAENAVDQLLRCAGRTVIFHTAVCLLAPAPPRELAHVDETRVRFRRFSEAEARRYVEADQPLDCAGSFKAEQRGVVLFEGIDNTDPTAIQGLPLIWLAAALNRFGVRLL